MAKAVAGIGNKQLQHSFYNQTRYPGATAFLDADASTGIGAYSDTLNDNATPVSDHADTCETTGNRLTAADNGATKQNSVFSEANLTKFLLFVSLLLFLSSCSYGEHEKREPVTNMAKCISDVNPSVLNDYEQGSWGKATWNISTLLGAPAICLLVVPPCETYSYLAQGNDQYFFSPGISYMINPNTRYISDRIIIQPIYYTLSVPMVLTKHLYETAALK